MLGPSWSVTEPLPEGELLRLDPWSDRLGWALGGWFLLIAALSLLNGVVEGNIASLIVGPALGYWGVGFLGLPGSGLIVYRHGIVIREAPWGRQMRSREWIWSEVDHFEVSRPRMKWALRVHFTDGRIESVPLLERKAVRKRPVAKAWVAELNRRAASARAASD